MKKRIALHLAVSAAILGLCPPSSAQIFAGWCRELIQQKGYQYEKISGGHFAVLKRAGGKFVECEQEDTYYTWMCGDLKLGPNYRGLYDKSGTLWSTPWKRVAKTEIVCHKQEDGNYLQIYRDRYKAFIEAANLELTLVEGTKSVFKEIKPNF